MNTKTKPVAAVPAKRYGTIEEWCADSGMGRTKTYEKIGAGVIRAVKADGRTLIDYTSGFAYLDGQPDAKIRVSPSHRKAKLAGKPSAATPAQS